jgi:hypothetical protein
MLKEDLETLGAILFEMEKTIKDKETKLRQVQSNQLLIYYR